MSDYLESLGPKATVGEVFTDLYGRVDQLIDELDQIRKRGGGDSSSPTIPGMPLRFGWSWGRGEAPGSSGFTTTVRVANGFATTNLLAKSVYRKSAQASPIPSRVGGYRGRELGPDYCLAYDDPRPGSRVDLRLGKFGLWQTPQYGRSNEPIGRSVEPIDEPVVGLDHTARSRLEIITQGILDNVTAVEMIRVGADVREVLEAAGKPPQPVY